MISHSDTVQTLTLGMAFLALFIGATASLNSTTENVLYTQKINASTTDAITSASQTTDVTTRLASSGDSRGLTSWSPQFTAIALAASSQANSGAMRQLANISKDNQEQLNGKTPKEVHQQAQNRAKSAGGSTPVMTSTDKREILWLARIMYSETKRYDEQRLIGWVVRNRVDTGYTGRTYEDVAKHSSQFSGLHPYDKRYEHNISRWYSSDGKSWETALSLAKEIYFADESERPLALTTRHFYSPNAVAQAPSWAHNRQPTKLIRDPQTSQVRFALYDKVR